MSNFPRSNSFDSSLVRSKIMGPNPLKLCEELLSAAEIPCGSRACDLGSGNGITSVMLAREYGRDPDHLGKKLLPYVADAGKLYLSIPGMVRDCHDELPECLLASWTPEQLEYMHDVDWWRDMISRTDGVRPGHRGGWASMLLRTRPGAYLPADANRRSLGSRPC